MIADSAAARHGFTRSWFGQVRLDQGRTRLRHVILYDGALYAQTDAAMVHAIDAETGKTLWSKQIGQPNHPSLIADACNRLLAVVNGSRLYVADRLNDGELLYEADIKNVPGAGPALSSRRLRAHGRGDGHRLPRRSEIHAADFQPVVWTYSGAAAGDV